MYVDFSQGFKHLLKPRLSHVAISRHDNKMLATARNKRRGLFNDVCLLVISSDGAGNAPLLLLQHKKELPMEKVQACDALNQSNRVMTKTYGIDRFAKSSRSNALYHPWLELARCLSPGKFRSCIQ